MPGIASAATAVVIGHVAGGTSTIRVGAGRHHAAEPLAADGRRGSSARWRRSIPGRIDLGLGRAPGTDHGDRARAPALPRTAPTPSRRTSSSCIGYFGDAAPGQRGQRRPRRRARTCRSGSSARASSARSSPPQLGLPYAFASHFAPGELEDGDRGLPRRPSAPRRSSRRLTLMLGFNVFAAETDAEGAPAAHLDAAGLRQPAHRPPRPAAAAGRGGASGRSTRCCWRRSSARSPAPRSARRERCAPGSRHSSRAHAPDEMILTGADPRPRRAAPLVRDRRRGDAHARRNPGQIGGDRTLKRPLPLAVAVRAPILAGGEPPNRKRAYR